MTTNDADRKDSIARDLGWDSYADAPAVVQRNIDSLLDEPFVEAPFSPLDR